jgi:hypothetical protein
MADYSYVEAVACPKCGAKTGKQCTYVVSPDESSKDRKALAGRPTKKPHHERFAKLERILSNRAQGASERLRVEQRRNARQRANMSVRRAMFQVELRENAQMVDWLREHGHILLEASQARPLKKESHTALALEDHFMED